MELPDSITTIGAQLSAGGNVVPTQELYSAYDVFSAEQTKVFMRPWIAVDHASRLGRDGRWLRFDVGVRSVLVVRESAECIHALRNSCLHAGYRVCDDEDGYGEQLFCPYHGWYYALDGRLTDPNLRPDIADRSRYRLPRYAMQIRNGLIFVDMSALAPLDPVGAPLDAAVLPAALADGVVTRRQRFPTTWNWKYLRQFLRTSPQLFIPGGECEIVEFGPMSLMLLGRHQAVLLRVMPKFPGQSDFDVVDIALDERESADGSEHIGEAVRRAGEAIAAAPLGWLDREFFAWYWPLMAEPAAA